VRKLATAALILMFGCATAGPEPRLQEPSEPERLAVLADAPAQMKGIVPTQDPNYVPRIGFDGEVDAESVEATISIMAAVTSAGAKAVVIEFNTPGGEVNAGFKLAKVIEESPIPVYCVVDGEAASMGFYLLQSCNVRLMTRRSSLMAHQPAIYGQAGGPEVAWKNISEALRVMARGMTEHMAHRMNVSADFMEAKIAGGAMWWFDWREALNTNAVDGVCDNVSGLMASLRKNLTPGKLQTKP
jgi:ATP-dependent protease ClpP protease subunit